MKPLTIINITIFTIIFTLGALSILILSHELYHFLSVDGEPTGICFGNCELVGYQNFSHAISGVIWKYTSEQETNLNLEKEEKNAWIFAFLVTSFVIILFLISERRLESQGEVHH